MGKNSTLHQAGLETNLLYMMSLAMDRIMRHCEYLMAKNKEAFKQEKRQVFNRYTKAVRTACVLQDMLTQDIYDVEERYDYRNVDTWLEQANELARLDLLFADRSANVDTVESIFKHIRELPGEGIVDEKLLESFYLK